MSKELNLSEDLNSTVLSIGTESLGLSSSVDIQNLSKNLQKGGFMSLFNDKFATLALEACKKGEFNVVIFLILEDKISNFSQACPDGFTILHYLVAYYNMIKSYDNRIDQVIDKILKRDDVADFINLQDYKYNNTPLHLAVMINNNELSNKLDRAGANTKLRNNNDMYVATATETDTDTDLMKEVQRQMNSNNNNSNNANNNNNNNNNNSPFLKMTDTLSGGSDEDNNIKSMVDALFNMEGKNKNTNSVISSDLPQTMGETDDTKIENTEQFLSDMIKNYKPNADNQMGGRIVGSRNLNNNSNNYVSSDSLSSISSMSGGANYSTKSKSKSKSKSRKHNNMSELSDLSRMIENQASTTHQRVVERIKKLLNVDDLVARAYKALLYSKIKNEKPELNNFDRAVEMEKITNLDVLQSLDKSKLDELVKHISEKDKERTNSPNPEKSKPKNKKTSKSEKVVSETSEYSPTSEEPVQQKKTKKSKEKKTETESSIFSSDFMTSSDEQSFKRSTSSLNKNKKPKNKSNYNESGLYSSDLITSDSLMSISSAMFN